MSAYRDHNRARTRFIPAPSTVAGYRASQSLHSGNPGNRFTFYAMGVTMTMSVDPAAWLARDFGTDPATGLDGVTVVVLQRTRLSADGDAAAVRAVLDVATRGSAWRALQLQDPMNITILATMRNAAAARRPATAPDILVSAVLNQVRLAMFPGRRAATGTPPIVAEGSYFSQWWRTHVRRRS
jgi:hypothetical protein